MCNVKKTKEDFDDTYDTKTIAFVYEDGQKGKQKSTETARGIFCRLILANKTHNYHPTSS